MGNAREKLIAQWLEEKERSLPELAKNICIGLARLEDLQRQTLDALRLRPVKASNSPPEEKGK